MSIETSNFVVIRDNDPFRCKGDELLSTVDQRDALLISRNDVIHKVKLPFNLDKVASVENKSVNLNYEQYAFVRNRDNGQTLAETSPPFASVQQELRVYEHLFDGDENTTFKSYTNNGIRHELVVQFPEPIDVYGSIRIKAGFHDHARTGQLLINGNIVRELSAWDGDPQVFSADFEGQVSEFSIRQKHGASNGYAYTAVLNYIELDGEKLKSVVPSSTELTLSPETDMSKYKVNMRVKKYQGNVTGVIGAVDEVNKKITLTGLASFSADDEIIIDQIDGNPIDFPEILDTDLFAATDTDDITYKVTGAQFKQLIEPVSWEDCAIDGWLRYGDCEAGCDSQYCSDMCKQLFAQHIQDTCGGVPPNWYSSDMTPQSVADRIFADGYTTTVTIAPDPEVPEVVTVVNGVFHIDGVAQPTLSIAEQTYIVFDQSDPSNNGHPLRIYEDVNRTTEVTDGVHIDGSKLTLLGLYPGTYYYQCANHAGMGGALIVTAS